MPALNNVTTKDDYAAETTLDAPQTERVTIYVSGAGVYYQLAQHGPTWGGTEHFVYPPGTSVDRLCHGVRVRSAVKGLPAQVTIDAARAGTVPRG